jgi:hypothetical protein
MSSSQPSPRSFSSQELKKIRRGQRKFADEIQKLRESVDCSDVKSPTWLAFANKNCKNCWGRGILEFNHPKRGEYHSPCGCSIHAKAKATGEFKNRPVWVVTRNGVEEKVYAPSKYENG